MMNETGDEIDQHVPQVPQVPQDPQDATDDWANLDAR